MIPAKKAGLQQADLKSPEFPYLVQPSFSPMLRSALLLTVLAISACSTPGTGSVTRSECLAIAETYRSHRWHPSAANVFHGVDPDGVRVDTPDISYRPPGAVPGWWLPGQVNEGVPYQWGGFAMPEQFDRDLASGMAAGDVYTQEKRRLLDAAVSRHATGIDCSGLVSRCWKLPRSFSTREFARICDPLSSWDDLRPGDILNTYNSHVMLFAGWLDTSRTHIIAYETGIPPFWLVVRHPVGVDFLRQKGFAPFRYRGMRDG